jgi:hypothetical protein
MEFVPLLRFGLRGTLTPTSDNRVMNNMVRLKTSFLILCGQHCIMRDHIQYNNLPVTALPPAIPSSLIARSLCPILPWVCSSTSAPSISKHADFVTKTLNPQTLVSSDPHRPCRHLLHWTDMYSPVVRNKQTCFVKERRRYLPINSKSSSYRIQGPH